MLMISMAILVTQCITKYSKGKEVLKFRWWITRHIGNVVCQLVGYDKFIFVECN